MLKSVLILFTISTNLFSNSLIIKEAKTYLGVPYSYEGRSKKSLDCLGLVYLSYAKVSGKSWLKFPVNPWQLIEQRTFGETVKGLNGVSTENLDFSLFKEGDYIHILSLDYYMEGIKPLATIEGLEHYGVHFGIYAGDGEWIHANPYIPFPKKVILHSFKDFINETGLPGILVTRLEKK